MCADHDIVDVSVTPKVFVAIFAQFVWFQWLKQEVVGAS